jgi:carboxylesterase type B
MRVTSELFIFSIQGVCALSATSGRGAGAQVQTSSGLVSGHAASNATTVSEYLGIPYAEPPVDELRFAPPQKLDADPADFINGTNFVRIPVYY